ncbi:MAG TPA: HD domain-containing phosphohydrolase, partial [Candidatus Latescibacteria bacterium]|nr:HD domain-containing phosphohydrolase [Candidatus Latescibacterota bacterium]
CNTPGEFLKDEAIDRLKAIAAKTFLLDGVETPYLTENELKNLSIRKGSLTEEERQIINNHVSVTIKMLSQLPFPKKLSHVVEYAGAHHEKLNGAGYPNGWTAERLAIQSRILCLADICEALTAADRPYKPAMPKERAFQILGFMAKDQEIDERLLKLFMEKEVYDRYMLEYKAQKEAEAAAATAK